MSNTNNVIELKRAIDESRGAKAPLLEPAFVVAIADAAIEVELPGGERSLARVALAYPYAPRIGDEVLVVGNEKGCYVIGVLSGKGKTELVLPGDVDVRAEGGELRLSSDRKVSLEAPEVSIRAGSLSTIAGAAVERFHSLTKSVRELFTLRAGAHHTSVEGASVAQAKTTTILSEKKVTINGKEIFLG